VAATFGFGPDHLAGLFCPESGGDNLVAEKARFEADGSMMPFRAEGRQALRDLQAREPHKYHDILSYLQCRTCVGDDTILQWVEDYPEGCNVVVLGAGYDTRLYRLPLPESAQLFEVDAPGTQSHKLAVLSACESQMPNQARVTYVALDFQMEEWMDRLIASGLQKELPTVIIWEGVIYYLPQEVVERTLTAVAEEFKGPAAIFFDYFHPELVGELTKTWEKLGEPMLFGITSDDLDTMLARAGLWELDHLTMEECVERYVPRTAGGESLGVGSPGKYFVVAGNSLCRDG